MDSSEAVARRCFVKKGVVKNFANFTGKHLCWSVTLVKLCSTASVHYSYFGVLKLCSTASVHYSYFGV